MDAVLEAYGLVKTFGALRALDGVDIRVPRGKITLLIGPNGSGKSTLINVLSGVYKPDAGKIILDGEEITHLPPHERFRRGLVRSFQIPRLFSGLAVIENTVYARYGNPGEGVISGLFRRKWLSFEEETARRAARYLGITKIAKLWSRKPSELSGGQMKLLEIARVLMPDNPKVILMDEPTAGVNPTLAHEIFQFIRSLRDRYNLSFLIIEHRLDIAVEYVDYAYAMALGRIIAEGKPREVLENPVVIDSYLGG
ncbi:ABC transporter ATP-binding protein [Pyrofollis japonicus]|uniref:ABC transporter ATP-binding protein n=1 Tax=Pyrofollis japonicus TaxID=3060460 RepID=UPI00295AD00B|nr:ABC transporter ATP-binding protein [Pyrofollis japonicus]BEP17782.1 ABC transporter ATP-binding protein [Pyrofollis japonicus]